MSSQLNNSDARANLNHTNISFCVGVLETWNEKFPVFAIEQDERKTPLLNEHEHCKYTEMFD